MASTSDHAAAATSGPVSFRFFVIYMALPYWIGVQICQHNLELVHDLLSPMLSLLGLHSKHSFSSLQESDRCLKRFALELHRTGSSKRKSDNAFVNFSLIIHRNGEAEPCDTTNATFNLMQHFQDTVMNLTECPPDFADKYQVEALLTRVLHSIIACSSPGSDRTSTKGFYGYCDMGPLKTPILTDHDRLVPLQHASTWSLPCHFHDKLGVRITTLRQFAQLAMQARSPSGPVDPLRELHIYAVPAGRVFQHAPSYIGETIHLPHVRSNNSSLNVSMTVLSISPRVWEIHNFFSKHESNDLVRRALSERRESHRIKRSSTGAVGYTVNSQRTSESGFDTHSKMAVLLKRRCFDVLGFDEYIESHSDGLQILRYNLTTAYMPHMDWIDGGKHLEHNYDSAGVGGNRFATILLYMSDLNESAGGETVFPEAWPLGQSHENRIDEATALRQLRQSKAGAHLTRGSWEEKMGAQCRTRLAIRPNSARAILFYSQHPDGREDKSSIHGACPVLSGQKYAANLWVWNTPREGYEGNPKRSSMNIVPTTRQSRKRATESVTAIFRNTGTYKHVDLYFGTKRWAVLGKDNPLIRVKTFPGQHWSIRIKGSIITSWKVGVEAEQTFHI